MNESQTLYGAEDAVANWLRQALDHGGLITVNRREFRPEAELKFGQVQDIQRYVDRVLTVLRENGHDFNGRQDIPVTVRERAGAEKATYSQVDLTISIPPREIGGEWALRELVVLHEITHHLAPGTANHGVDFRTAFLRLLEAVGKPVTAEMVHNSYCNVGLSGVSHDVAESTLDKIAKLLRQAEGTSNESEASAFTTMAQKLATKHSIALAVARAAAAKRDEREEPVVECYQVGPRRGRGNQEKVFLLYHVSQANDVRITIYPGNTAVDMYGFQSDIDVVKSLYESLVAQMEIAYRDLLNREPVAYEMHNRVSRDETGKVLYDERGVVIREKIQGEKIHGTTRRVSFYDGFQSAVGSRLREAKREAISEIEKSMEWSEETALVVREKELEVSDFYSEKTKHIRSKWKTSGRNSSGVDHASGREAGARASLGTERALG